MATTYAGMFGSGDWNAEHERPKRWLEQAFELWPDSPGTFLMILQKLRKRVVEDWEFNLFELRLPDMEFVLNGAVDATTTDLVFDSPTYPMKGIVAGTLLKDYTSGEVVLVAADPVSPWTTISVTRHYGSTNLAAGIADDAVLRWAGNLYGEGSRSPTAVSHGTDRVTNYTQIFKNTAKVTKTSEKIKSRPYQSWNKEKKQAFERHRIAICEALYHSVKASGTDKDGNRATSMNGLDAMITTNLWDASGGVTLDDLEDNLEQVFAKGSSKRLGLFGQRAFGIINRVVSRSTMGTWNMEAAAKTNLTYGLIVRRLHTPSGILDMVVDPLLTLSSTYTKSGYILDTENVEFVTLKGCDTEFHDNTQLPDEAAHKGHYETECSIAVALEETHAHWTNMNEFAG